MNQRKRRHQNHSRDEFKKARPPSFNGEIKTGQEAEAKASWDEKIFPSPRLFRKYEG